MHLFNQKNHKPTASFYAQYMERVRHDGDLPLTSTECTRLSVNIAIDVVAMICIHGEQQHVDAAVNQIKGTSPSQLVNDLLVDVAFKVNDVGGLENIPVDNFGPFAARISDALNLQAALFAQSDRAVMIKRAVPLLEAAFVMTKKHQLLSSHAVHRQQHGAGHVYYSLVVMMAMAFIHASGSEVPSRPVH